MSSWHAATDPAFGYEAGSIIGSEDRDQDERGRDAVVELSVRQALAADGLQRLNVRVVRGVVTLQSQQTNALDRERAMEIARQVDGVVDVVDRMS
ncbi:MAG: BON domain-containing protein [bacterium]